MCGRYFLLENNPKLTEIIMKAKRAKPDVEFSLGEIFPGTHAPILIGLNQKIYARFAHWGLFHKIINARQESLDTKPIFKNDFKHHRALVPVSGFYEWDKNKQRYCFIDAKEPLLYLAAIYNEQQEFTIITKDAINPIKPIHHRMPVIIRPDQISQWFFDEDEARNLLSQDYEDLKIMDNSVK